MAKLLIINDIDPLYPDLTYTFIQNSGDLNIDLITTRDYDIIYLGNVYPNIQNLLSNKIPYQKIVLHVTASNLVTGKFIKLNFSKIYQVLVDHEELVTPREFYPKFIEFSNRLKNRLDEIPTLTRKIMFLHFIYLRNLKNETKENLNSLNFEYSGKPFYLPRIISSNNLDNKILGFEEYHLPNRGLWQCLAILEKLVESGYTLLLQGKKGVIRDKYLINKLTTLSSYIKIVETLDELYSKANIIICSSYLESSFNQVKRAQSLGKGVVVLHTFMFKPMGIHCCTNVEECVEKIKNIEIEKVNISRKNQYLRDLYEIVNNEYKIFMNKSYEEIFNLDHILLLNLDRRKDRLESMKVKLDKIGMNYTRISAIDGQDPKIKEDYERNHINNPFLMSSGALGCLLSYKKIVDEYSHSKRILILEDDIYFDIDFKNKLFRNRDLINDENDVIYLGCSQYDNVNSKKGRFYRANKYSYGTYGFIINQKILKLYKNYLQLNTWKAADNILLDIVNKKNIKTLVFNPNLIISNLFDSNISTQKHLVKRNEIISSNLQSYYIYDDARVLVVMPTYNRSHRLQKQINMLSNQIYKNFKFLVINDGSNGENQKKYREIIKNNSEKKNLIYIENTSNLHIAKTINKGMRYFLNHDEFTYFTWISDDNDYYEYFIYDLIQNNEYFSYSNYILEKNGSRSIIKKYKDFNDLRDHFMGLTSFMWHKDAVKQIGFYNTEKEYCCVEDFEYLLRTFKNNFNRCLYKNKVHAKFYVHPDSLTTKEQKSNKIKSDNLIAKFKL